MKKLYDIPMKKVVTVFLLAMTCIYFIILPTAKMLLWKKNRQETKTYTSEEMQMLSLICFDNENNLYYSTDSDPQIVIDFEHPVWIESIKIDIDYSYHPGTVVAYYSHGREVFSDQHRVLFDGNPMGEIKMSINQKNISVLRIDPAMYGGIKMKINSVTVNPQKALSDYYKVSFEDFVYFTLLTGFTLSFVLLTRQIYGNLIAQKDIKRSKFKDC